MTKALRTLRICLVVAAATCAGAAHARGVSPYLPLNQSPEIERKIERLLILADRPILTRPIAAATVLDALPKACERDAVLCDEVRKYLDGFMRNVGIGYLSAAVGGGSGAKTPLPNRHGMSTDSSYEVSGVVFWQPGDRLLVSGGVQAYSGDSTPTGTMVSLGRDFAQLDVGYRDHWLSPLTESAMLISTEAATMPSVTLSNYRPLTRFGVHYEAFVAQMSHSDNIVFDGGLTAGRPLLAGVHLSFEPFSGWSFGVNRLLQFGGGDRPHSASDLLNAFVNPSSDNRLGEFGNQTASFTTRFLVPGTVPLAVYLEYAGEDTSTNNNLRLGNAALAAGVELPQIAGRFALTFEISEWQNAWYVHHLYLDGMQNAGRVIGHWGADWRLVNDGVGARSWLARIGFTARGGAEIEATYRTLDNQSYGAGQYERAHLVDARYSRRWRQFSVGGELNAGRDSFGESFARVSAFIRY
jgi:hypothetical protein